MQRFEALHPQLRSLPQQVFASIAQRGQTLHEEFLSLQKQSMAISGDAANMPGATGRGVNEKLVASYAALMIDFAERMSSFVRDTEGQVKGSAMTGAGPQ